MFNMLCFEYNVRRNVQRHIKMLCSKRYILRYTQRYDKLETLFLKEVKRNVSNVMFDMLCRTLHSTLRIKHYILYITFEITLYILYKHNDIK